MEISALKIGGVTTLAPEPTHPARSQASHANSEAAATEQRFAMDDISQCFEAYLLISTALCLRQTKRTFRQNLTKALQTVAASVPEQSQLSIKGFGPGALEILKLNGNYNEKLKRFAYSSGTIATVSVSDQLL